MKRLIFAIASIIALYANALTPSLSFDSETLQYKVMYKWGLISKQAGTVEISLDAQPNEYHALLTAKSAPWADKFFEVRDTLTCDIMRDGFKPKYYVKRSHEGGTYEFNIVDYDYSGNSVTGNCSRYRTKDGKLKNDDKRVLQAEGVTLDMFSAFYYMRALPFEDWDLGHTMELNIFSGRRKELLTIHYQGIEDIEYDGNKYECYKITFKFTSDGKTKTSDDMTSWISADSARLPIKLEGKLPVGSIKCFLINPM